MGISSVAAQPILSKQSSMALEALKQNAQSEQQLAETLANSASPSSTRGTNLDISV